MLGIGNTVDQSAGGKSNNNSSGNRSGSEIIIGMGNQQIGYGKASVLKPCRETVIADFPKNRQIDPEEFTEEELEKVLEKGIHEITIVYNQIEEDLETVHAQVNVGLQLVVQ